MLRNSVESSNISEIAWENDVLFVTFKRGGATYKYPGVPLTTYNEMLEAPSPGKFLNSHIIPLYEGVPI